MQQRVVGDRDGVHPGVSRHIHGARHALSSERGRAQQLQTNGNRSAALSLANGGDARRPRARWVGVDDDRGGPPPRQTNRVRLFYDDLDHQTCVGNRKQRRRRNVGSPGVHPLPHTDHHLRNNAVGRRTRCGSFRCSRRLCDEPQRRTCPCVCFGGSFALDDRLKRGDAMVVSSGRQRSVGRQPEGRQPLVPLGRAARARRSRLGDFQGGTGAGRVAAGRTLHGACPVQFRARTRRVQLNQRLPCTNGLARPHQHRADTPRDLRAQRPPAGADQPPGCGDRRHHVTPFHRLGPDHRQRSAGPRHLAPGSRRSKRHGCQRYHGLGGGTHRATRSGPPCPEIGPAGRPQSDSPPSPSHRRPTTTRATTAAAIDSLAG